MSKQIWSKTDRVMREIHLYTGLFLAPWMLVYAVSAVLFSHPGLSASYREKTKPEWKTIREGTFPLTDEFPADRAQQAEALLEFLGLSGPHRILNAPQGLPPRQGLTVFRVSGGGAYRVQWRRDASQLVVQRQRPFSALRFVHFLHFRHGYAQPYWAHILWGVSVDLVSLSMFFWVVSGVYIWARRPKRRVAGAVFLGFGLALFVVLAVALLQ